MDTTTFPFGYRFNFTFPADITINTKSLKGKIPYEFKIKKQANSNNLTLEQAWTDDNTFTKKAGLDCSNSSSDGCTVSSESQKLNVKVGNQKSEGITTVSTGKIKMETEQEGYNQGLKFTIGEGNASLSGGSGEITKLEELETYEITEDGGKYYLTKKTSPDQLIKTSLVLPSGCELPGETSVVCTLNQENFKKINFDGKGGDVASEGDVTLTISKGNSTDFPFGYRFTFSAEKEATVTSSNKIKAKIPTDFKIKKGSGSGTSVSLTLEKAWDDTSYSLAGKVGLNCTGSGDVCCNMDSAGSVKLNVKKGSDKKEDITGIGTTPGKIKVEKDKEGYNQGLKFTISEGDVSLTDGTKTAGEDFTTLEELETYEITEDKGKYYLTRKTEASEAIEKQLGLKEAGCSLSTGPCTLNTDKLKKINFDDKNTDGASMASGNATLTITKADKTDFPLGYKFTLQSTAGDITIKTTDNIVKKGISTDFKIKRTTNGGNISLEKAWTMESLGNKVGLQNCNTGGSSNECSIQDGQLKVKQQDKYSNDVKSGGLSKATNSGGSTTGKIKVIKDQEGYNQGFKFEISEGSIDLTGSSGTEESKKIHTLGEFETYEIKEDEEDKQWYLVRKERADKFIKDQLKLVDAGCSESENFPHTSSDADTTCNIKSLEKLKKIKFEGENGNNISGTVSEENQVQLTIKKDSKLPGGFKFTFSGGSNVCLPNGSSGKVSLGSSNVDYKIKKNTTGGTTTLTLEKCSNGGSSSTCT